MDVDLLLADLRLSRSDLARFIETMVRDNMPYVVVPCHAVKAGKPRRPWLTRSRRNVTGRASSARSTRYGRSTLPTGRRMPWSVSSAHWMRRQCVFHIAERTYASRLSLRAAAKLTSPRISSVSVPGSGTLSDSADTIRALNVRLSL